MQTIRPLSYDGSALMVGGRYSQNSLGDAANSDADGHRINATWISKFADDTFGIALGYSHINGAIQENQVGLYEPRQAIGDNWRPGVPAGTWYSDGIKALRRTGYAERDGLMATLQFRPSNAWTSTLDLFYTQAEQEDTANQFEVHIGDYNGGFGRLQVTNPVINGNGTFTGGTANNVYPLVRGMYNHREDEIKAAGWLNEFNVGKVEVVADVGYSKANRDELNLENNTQLYPMPQLDSVNLAFRSGGFSQLDPGRDYSNPASLYLNNTIYGSGYGKVPSVEDELKTFKLVGTFPAGGWFSGVDAGLNYADRQKAKTQPEGNINLGAQGPTAIAQDLQYTPVNLGFAGIGYIPSWNVPAAVERYMDFRPVDNLAYLIPKAWTVDEEITTGFVRADIDTEWGGVPVTGNIGVQIQHVDQSSSANFWDATQPAGSEISPLTPGSTYTDVLPSMNLAFSLAHEQMLRVALAKQTARPRVDQMRASLEFGVNTATGRPGGSGGNPELEPWRANAFDISYEKYFGTKAYVAAAYFYKDLENYIYTQTRDDYDFSNLLVDYVPPPGTQPPQAIGDFTQPMNGEGGSLQGLELTASIPFELFSSALTGFGVVASASFFDSSIEILDPESASSVGSDPIALPGLSDRVYNWTLYYERNGFEARINQRRRSDFIGEIGNFNGNRSLRYVVGENITDAQLSYSFSSGSLAGMTLLLQGSNLTNEAYQTYAGSKDRPLEFLEWGRTITVGLNYRF